MSLSRVWVHNLEPKRRAALRFPSFWVQNFALFQPNDNFPSSIFLNLNRFSPPTEGCFAYLRMLRLVVSEFLFLLLVNRSPRFGCIAGCRSLLSLCV